MWICTRFLKLSSVSQTIIVLGCAILACSCTKQRAPEPSFIQKQEATLRLLDDYIKTSDWHKRVLIMNATGESEILATRIFGAFDILDLGHAPMDDVSIVAAAWNEIYTNAALSLAVLQPIVFERATEEDKTKWANETYLPVSGEKRSLYLQICSYIGQIETNSAAQSILTKFSQSTNAELAAEARTHLERVSQENWHAMRKSYLETKSRPCLQWLAHHALRKGMTKAEAEMYIGAGVANSHAGFDYISVDGGAKSILALNYWDGILYRWEWRD